MYPEFAVADIDIPVAPALYIVAVEGVVVPSPVGLAANVTWYCTGVDVGVAVGVAVGVGVGVRVGVGVGVALAPTVIVRGVPLLDNEYVESPLKLASTVQLPAALGV